jgi:hypothetical protein
MLGRCAIRVIVGNTELITDRLEQLSHREARVQDEGHVRIRWHLAQQIAQQRGFAGTYFSGDQNEAALGKTVAQMRKCFPVPRAQVQKLGVWRDRERCLTQGEVLFVHRRPPA